MDDDILRNEVRALKAFHDITYKEIAERIDIKQRSIYNWLNGEFDLSANRKRRLYRVIQEMKG